MDLNKNLVINKKLAQRIKEAKAAGQREIGTLGKVHNLIVHIRSSESRWNKFKALCGRSIPMDNDICWNLWFIVLDVIKQEKVQLVINAYITDWYKEVKDDYLTLEDQKIINKIYSFLQLFYKVTLINQGNFLLINQTLYTMDLLIKHYKRLKVSFFNTLKALLNLILQERF